MASVIVTSGACQGDYFPIGATSHEIGRVSDVSIRLPDERISRRHCRIEFDPHTGAHVIIDLSSRNGTEIRREGQDPITVGGDAVPLADGDLVSVAGVEVRFTVEDFADKESAAKHAHLKRWFGEEFRNTLGM